MDFFLFLEKQNYSFIIEKNIYLFFFNLFFQISCVGGTEKEEADFDG